MSASSGTALVVGLGLGLCSFALAQDPGRPARLDAGPGSFADSVGLQWLDGELWAAGRDFKVQFEADRLTYTPALGSRAPRNIPLSLRVESFGRGTPREPVGPARPAADALTASYDRGPFVERYDVTPKGIKQSFVFETLPAGSGDLVVRLRLDTELEPSVVGTTDGEILFTAGDLGGVRIGEVIGIDGAGERVRGSMRYQEGTLDLVLPAAFVDDAALPITLDPLIGGSFYAQEPLDNRDPDVAFDASEGVYLVVFERRFSASDSDIHAQRVNRSGALVGSLIPVHVSRVNELNPVVANVNQRNAFVVVYWQNHDLYGRSVSAANGSMSAVTPVANSRDTEIVPDLGGEATTSHDGVVCVWQNATANRIVGRRITVSSTGALSLGSFTNLVTGGSHTLRFPRIAKSGGGTGRYLVVYQDEFASDSSVHGLVIDRDLNILDPFIAVAASAYEERPDVDGDGTQWVAAWQTSLPSGGPTSIDARSVFFDPASSSAVLGSPIVTIDQASTSCVSASVAWVGNGTCLVGWQQVVGTSTSTDIYARAIDLFSCLDCEGPISITQATTNDYALQMASELSGGGNTESALIVWEERRTSPSVDGDIRARRWSTFDGFNIDLGGGCGGGGTNEASCVRVDNPDFHVRVRGATPAATAWLIVGLDRFDLPCGSCTLVPNPWNGFVLPGPATDGYGNAAIHIPIPNIPSLNGAAFYTQWLVAGAGCSATNSALSNAEFVQIQQ